MTTTSLPAALTIRALGAEPEITITTPHTDLMRDTIDTEQMETVSYMGGTRAVHLFHDHGQLPIAKTLSLTKTAQGILARFQWLDANPEAAIVREVFAEGVLGASVEFVPVESVPNRSGGLHYSKSILTGWALTGNPANPRCTRMMKSLGLAREAPGLYVTDDESDAPVLVLRDDEDDRVTFDPRDLALAIRTVMEARVQAAVRLQTQGWPGLAPSAPVLLVEDEQGETCAVSGDELRAAITTALERTVTPRVRAAVNALTGRLD